MKYSQTLIIIIDDAYESSNIASQKDVFLVISHYGAIYIPIYQLLNTQCMHEPHCYWHKNLKNVTGIIYIGDGMGIK